MADVKITALPADASPTGDDLIVIVNDPGGTPANRKVTLDNLDTYLAQTTKTLTNKTLTAPKIANGGFLADANGNEGIILVTTGSAVNEITVTNAATATNPTITASGSDANVGVTIMGKGAGAVKMGNAMAETSTLLTDGATITLDASLANIFRIVALGDRTLLAPTNPTTGQKIVIRHNASGGARTLTLTTGANGFRFGSDITTISQTASGKTDYIGAIWNTTDTVWDVVAFTKGF